IVNYLGAVGIRMRVRTMERAAFLSAWRDKKLRGVFVGATGSAGNASTRIEAFATSKGINAYGSLPDVEGLFQRQLQEMDRKKREEMLHQIQRILADRVVFAPIWENGFIRAYGPRVEEAGLALIQAFPYSGPLEAGRLMKPGSGCHPRLASDGVAMPETDTAVEPHVLIEAYYEAGWTDGLPVVPPTDASVAAMLAAAGLKAPEVLGEIPGRNTVVTADKV